MSGTIFLHTLRRTWLQTLYWGLGLGAMAALSTAFVPFFDSMKMVEVLEGMPPWLLAAAGFDADLSVLATAEGIIAVSFFGKFALIFAAYPVVMGMRISANDEDEGILEVVLSLPLPRWRVIVERFLAYSLSILFICLLIYASLWLGAQLVTVGLDMARMAEVVFNVAPVLLLVLAFTALVATLLRKRQQALAVAVGFVAGSFLLDTITSMLGEGFLKSLQGLSFFHYYDTGAILQHGLSWSQVGGLSAIAALMAAGAVVAFRRRDVGL